MRRKLHSSAAARTSASANGCTLAASGDAADDCAEHGATADDGSRALAARLTFFLNITGGDAIGFALIVEAIERDGEFAGALQAAGGAGGDEFQIDVETFGDDDIAFNEDWGVEGATKSLARFTGGRVDAVNGAHGEDGAFRKSNRDGLRGRR